MSLSICVKVLGVHVEGRLQLNTWEKDGEAFESFSLSADDVTLKLSRLENVAFRAKRDEPVPA
jgi:single-stranded DNA-binding protein